MKLVDCKKLLNISTKIIEFKILVTDTNNYYLLTYNFVKK